MNAIEVVFTCLKEKNTTQEQLAHLLGYKSQSGLANRLRGNSLRVDTLVKILTGLGYTLVVKPYTFADKEKENYHIITNDEVTEE